MFPLFLQRTADVLIPRLSIVFGCFFVWLASLLAGEEPMIGSTIGEFSITLLRGDWRFSVVSADTVPT